MSGTVRRWPLFLIAAPAAVAIWSGWVGLGQLCGFGVIHPLPGIWDALRLDTAITLPIGVEAYGAYALGAWLSLGRDHPARTFARRSAIGSLVLGMAGQVIYHLLAAAHATRAPWPVVVLVACLPVVTLGFGAALTHLLRQEQPAPESTALAVPAPDLAGTRAELAAVRAERPGLEAAALAGRAPARRTARRNSRERSPVTPESAELAFAAELAAGSVPSVRQIKALGTGTPKAQAIRDHLAAIVAAGQAVAS